MTDPIQWVRVLEQGGAKLTDAGHAALGRNPEQLRQRCAWCSALIRDGALTPEGYESHGICLTCRDRVFPDPRMRDEDGFLTEHDPEPRFPQRPPEEDDA